MTTVHEALPSENGAGKTLVYTDPFDHRAAAPGGVLALDLAQEAAERGAGGVCWYGYDRANQRRWIVDLLRASAPAIKWWYGDLMVSTAGADMYDGDLGAATSPGTGFGLVCANVSSDALHRCDDLGRALSHAYNGRQLPDGRAGSLDYMSSNHGDPV